MKKITKSNQPEKAELQVTHTSLKKFQQHKAFDHSHGRINKTPFGINHEPGIF